MIYHISNKGWRMLSCTSNVASMYWTLSNCPSGWTTMLLSLSSGSALPYLSPPVLSHQPLPELLWICQCLCVIFVGRLSIFGCWQNLSARPFVTVKFKLKTVFWGLYMFDIILHVAKGRHIQKKANNSEQFLLNPIEKKHARHINRCILSQYFISFF